MSAVNVNVQPDAIKWALSQTKEDGSIPNRFLLGLDPKVVRRVGEVSV